MANILIVEDDPLVAATLQALAEAAGGRVVGTAEGLAAALEIAGRQRVDIALVDIQLAGFDSGLRVAAELSHRGVRCIFVTGTAPPAPMPEFAVGCIAKPCTLDAMKAALDAAEQWPRGGQAEQRHGFEAY